MKFAKKLTVIREAAFQNTDSAREIIVPDGTKKIYARAFADSAVQRIELPESLDFIADDAFADCAFLTLPVVRDSYAYRWCMAHDLRCEVVDKDSSGAVYGVFEVYLDGEEPAFRLDLG